MLSNPSQFLQLFRENLPFLPTKGQETAMNLLTQFLSDGASQLFILKGYAGTGKTSLVSALVKSLAALRTNTVLLAPTGRAAKVFSVYANKKAFTIHKFLYRVVTQEGAMHFVKRQNKEENALFIVDEVSMLAAFEQQEDFFSSRSLLEDLMTFFCEGMRCKMIFIGDDAQLPPVRAAESPALDVPFMQRNFGVNIATYQLTEPVRQAADSGILLNATKLRNKIMNDDMVMPLFSRASFEDFQRLEGADLEEQLNTLFSKYDHDDIVIVTRSNKRAYVYNREIRNRILYRENLIAAGDFLMAVKNNYFWVDETSEVGFIANGDIMEVLAINKTQSLYGFHFADVTVRLCDYPNYPNIDIKIILESLECAGASLPAGDTSKLYHAIAEDYADVSSQRARYLKIKNDPFYNAVQVKYSYALTCHKTQGGQWGIVLIDQLYLPDNQLDKELLRWLYTAVTRATEQVFLINFQEAMFG